MARTAPRPGPRADGRPTDPVDADAIPHTSAFLLSRFSSHFASRPGKTLKTYAGRDFRAPFVVRTGLPAVFHNWTGQAQKPAAA